ncbi:MAG: hypothetical protein A2854_01275 [Parcubacteria group bacterium RIFCSPHIGHO2_01_FULL_56_18]|nr:MAG: hypothetical protein A2854_01275 [Parcubacteria group bacterium RIFCSPHIGHO2_01_FULL_56_18]
MEPAEERLEEALRAWEDMSLFAECIARATPGIDTSRRDNDYARWRTFRRTLLNQSITDLRYEDWMPDLSHPAFNDARGSFASHGTFPLEFFGWTRWSRKAFVLEDIDQRTYEIASMSEVRWEDIIWPYFSFVVEFASPIPFVTTNGVSLTWTHALVTRFGAKEDEGSQAIFIRMLSKEGHLTFFNGKERKRIMGALKDGDDMAAAREIHLSGLRTGDVFELQGQVQFSIFRSNVDEMRDLVRFDEEGMHWRRTNPGRHAFNSSIRLPEEAVESTGRVARIVLGLCLDLDMLGASPRVAWTKRKTGRKYVGPLGIITKETDVCKILGRGIIDPNRYPGSSRNLKGQGFVRPHWRRKHRKRPPYSPPDHPKTVLVPARLINEHLVPYFGIIAGSITRMLSHE